MTDSTNGVGAENAATGVSRRSLLRGAGIGAIGAGLGALATGDAAAQPASDTLGWAQTAPAPYAGVRVLELSRTVAGRLAGQMFADQGAEVFVERPEPSADLDDAYFDRGKTQLPAGGLADLSSADVVILDGEAPVARTPHQIVLRIMAALPGDEAYGYLPHDCSDDLLNAVTAFFTDMSITGPMLGRPVIYTPLPLCSVYAAVNGAIGVGAALVDRTRTGLGREVTASRIAGGLSAIGALALTVEGLPEHLSPIQIGGLPPGLSPAEFREVVAKASAEPRWRLWLEQRFAPLAAPYRTLDGEFLLPLAGANRRLARQFLQVMGLYDEALGMGMVDQNPFDPANFANARNNLADSLALRFDLTSALADRLEPIFASRTAREWEVFLDAHDIPSTKVLRWRDWLSDTHARQSALITAVRGVDGVQIGRSAWVESAKPYADLTAPRRADALPPRAIPAPAPTGRPVATRPLEGFRMVDVSNVVAAPSCGRMLTELGVETVKILPPEPYHSPTIVAAWSAEMSAGKRTIILDARTPEGQGVARTLVERADLVLGNILDHQLARLRLDPVTLSRINPTGILVQVTALRGERRGPRHDEKGYDPSQQGTTGVTLRFGGPDAPTYHGIASCVDYLCGYLGAWAAVAALHKREAGGGGRGDWCGTSLAAAATLTQLLLQNNEPPATAVGQEATGMTPGARVYELSDGWIFAEGDADLSSELAGLTQAEALAALAELGVLATPVQSARAVADRHRDAPSRTVKFERTEKDGWSSECFAPTWIVYDNAPFGRSAPVSRVGADSSAILAEIGYDDAGVADLIARAIVLGPEWRKG